MTNLTDKQLDEIEALVKRPNYTIASSVCLAERAALASLIAEVRTGREAEPVAWRWQAKVKSEWSLWSAVDVDPNDWTWRDYWQDMEIEPLYASPAPAPEREWKPSEDMVERAARAIAGIALDEEYEGDAESEWERVAHLARAALLAALQPSEKRI